MKEKMTRGNGMDGTGHGVGRRCKGKGGRGREARRGATAL